MASIDKYLTEDEEIRLQWEGDLKPPENSSRLLNRMQDIKDNQTTFAVTNKRLVLLDSEDGFKDIHHTHISSVEANKTTEPKITSLQVVALTGLAFIALGLLVGLVLFINALYSDNIAFILFGAALLAIVGSI